MLRLAGATGAVGLFALAQGCPGARGALHLPGDRVCLWLLALCLHPNRGEYSPGVGAAGAMETLGSQLPMSPPGPVADPCPMATVAPGGIGSGIVSHWPSVHPLAHRP